MLLRRMFYPALYLKQVGSVVNCRVAQGVTSRPLPTVCCYRPPGKVQYEERNGSLHFQPCRHYGKAVPKKPDVPSQLDDLTPTMLKKEFVSVKLAEQTDGIVKKLLTLELASRKEKLEVKREELIDKVRKSPYDRSSSEVQIAVLTVKIRNLQEHLHKYPKDKSNKRRMLMAVDRRKKMLKNLRLTSYETFENVCQQLGIVYTFPPEYYRRVTRRWAAKKALCIKVFNEVKQKRLAEKRKLLDESSPKENSVLKEGTPI
ncbi:28S ribosomal protein S15, mitochondrial [Erpetoichthys calabaricus]|uniref:Small ribosomal subunit protein uS15m n=1 Tax=Erpetoichthys calabaricus TaxID=27687 RepID=A0A8C4T962_ERPCA|nr:28S ribosomal protein S15, mitochondrial [Erpetoichthys calabaricus]